ncbi:TrkH family potassium uptake protein [Pelagibacterales bacterium SAG-MED37]|nr:TrkH family potassium uptake protein [Pelagibacterales bacterium SAG-MED37]
MFSLQIKYLSFFFGLISVLSFFNIIYSYYLNLYLNLDTYYLTLMISLIISVLFYKIKTSEKKSSIFEKILTVFFGYLLIPLILSIPFYFSIYNLTFLDSYFESISGFTSTGFTIFENIKHIDQSLILWRSTTQWIGGLYFLFSIIFLIDIYDESFKKTLTNFFSFNSSEVLKQAFKIFLLYSGITLIIFIILNIFSIRSFDSLNLAFSLISSGGFLPVNDLSNIIKDKTQVIILSILMLTSFFSIFFSFNIIFLKNKNINFFYEDLHLIIYYIVVVTIFFLFFSFNNEFSSNLLSISSSMSNIGFSLETNQSNLNLIYLVLVIIGGSFFSTSSGLRFIKIYSLFKFSINQILSFSRPKNIFMNKLIFTKINFDFDEINKYFLTVLVFILSFFILTTLLSISGINFENSFKLSILTLMNTVNSSSYGLADFNFNNLNFFIKYSLIFFMIIGRIELLTILLIIKKFLLKN